MAHPRLAGIHAKLDRAREHIEELNAAAEAWLKNCAQPKFETEVDGEWEVVRLRIPETPPPRIAVIAGDVVHNLRSSLDHLAGQLVEAISGQATGDNYFPVLVDKRDFEARVWNKRGREIGPLVGIPLDHEVLKIIESHQPYCRGKANQDAPDADPLAFLNRMWNIDKHRVLHTTFLAPPNTAEEVLDLFKWNEDATLVEQHVGKVVGRSFEDGIELARFRFAPSDLPKPNVRHKGPIPTHVMVGYVKKGPGSMRIGLRGWDRIIARIEEVIADTERFL